MNDEDDFKIGPYQFSDLKSLVEDYELKLSVIRTEVAKDASKIVSDNLEKATALADSIIEQLEEFEDISAEDHPELQDEIKLCYEHLRIVDIVSKVSGVRYRLPFNYEYESRYDCGLEDKYWPEKLGDDLNKLYRLFEDMTGNSYNWFNSNC